MMLSEYTASFEDGPDPNDVEIPTDSVTAFEHFQRAWQRFMTEPTDTRWHIAREAYGTLRALLTVDEQRELWRDSDPGFECLHAFDRERTRRYHQTSAYVEWRSAYESKRNATEARKQKLREYRRAYRVRQKGAQNV